MISNEPQSDEHSSRSATMIKTGPDSTGVGQRYLAWTSLAFALLQSICSFAIAAGNLRVFIGVGALLFAAVTSTPAQAFHGEWVRLPMLLFSVVGALINLAVLWQVRRLRSRPAAQWRTQPLPRRKRVMEALQFWLGLATLLLVALELVAHHRVHGVYLLWLARVH